MYRNCRYLMQLFLSIFLVSLLFGTVHGEPVFTGPVRLSGPAIVGTVVITETNIVDEAGNPIVTFQFDGHCRGIPVSISEEFPLHFLIGPTQLQDFADIRADHLENTNIEDTEWLIMFDSGPPGCYSEYGKEPLVINTMMRFSNDGKQIVGGAVLLYVLPR